MLVQISTLLFEIRSRHKIKLNSNGSINHDDDENDDDGDHHISGIVAKRVRDDKDLHLHYYQCLTNNQEVMAWDHQASSQTYDMIPMFGLRPSELMSVLENLRTNS